MPAPSLSAEVIREFEAVRARNGVKPMSVEDEGAPLAGLPDNIYGFTYSPLNESTPLFLERSYQSFEVHKLTEGIVHLLGYVVPAEGDTMQHNSEPLEVKLYPEPYSQATRLVEISLERILRARPISRIDGNYLPLTLDARA